MKIALVAPLQEVVPPVKYGGIELVIYHLAEGLVKRGHQVTLFARAESKTSAKLVSLNIDSKQVELIEDRYIAGYNLACRVAEMSEEFDVINNHAGWRFLMFAPKLKAPLLNSFHNEFSNRLYPLFELYCEYPWTSISLNQQKSAPKSVKFLKNIYNGIDPEAFDFVEKPKDYLYWMARIVRKKGADQAIKIAKQTGKKLILAGPTVSDRPEEWEYWKTEVEPFIDGEQIKYLGPVNHQQKNELYGNALAFLNPISWEEPFGLVVPESNATGTPVVTYNMGAMNEIVRDGKNGFLIEAGQIDDMIDAIKGLDSLSLKDMMKLRRSCREYFENNFTIDKMVDNYLEAYRELIK